MNEVRKTMGLPEQDLDAIVKEFVRAEYPDNPLDDNWRLYVGQSRFKWDRFAQDFVENIRQEIKVLLKKTVENALIVCPVPTEIPEEELQRIRSYFMLPLSNLRSGECVMIDKLLQQVDHLTRALYDCGQDGSAKQWSAGYQRGVEQSQMSGFYDGAQAMKEEIARQFRRPDVDPPYGEDPIGGNMSNYDRESLRGRVLAVVAHAVVIHPDDQRYQNERKEGHEAS